MVNMSSRAVEIPRRRNDHLDAPDLLHTRSTDGTMKRSSTDREKVRTGNVPETRRLTPNELADRLAREASEANRPLYEAAWRACEEEHLAYERLFRAHERRLRARRRKSTK